MPSPGDVVYVFEGPLTPVEILERPNRFVVRVVDGGRERLCHLHDPGRLPELVRRGAKALVRPTRGAKTDCSITAIEAPNGVWVVADSRIHSDIAALFLPGAEREVKVGGRRLDFKLGDEYVEVKGCTLVENGRALFPDAPTRRGAEHMGLLKALLEAGYKARVVVLVMRPDAECFSPNWRTDPRFSRAFAELVSAGASVDVLRFRFEEGRVVFDKRIELCSDWANI
ncbi:MAG: DNA/RNA nuclease SfsA [Thermoproteus sp. AZ2]|jgi:sugar fermentation stimulation protein A|uniref:DNA/RNA nuclease SfsA n=1 Tax=Thermoproteus sp. AZ2 TaxID=1609232 RepID=A0ACC6UY45_9CREN|nr:MAG: XRE family transcriptional regulator [Thermoproteus sp. AZ2]